MPPTAKPPVALFPFTTLFVILSGVLMPFRMPPKAAAPLAVFSADGAVSRA